MTHADALAIPEHVTSKDEFYTHVIDTMNGQPLSSVTFLSELSSGSSPLPSLIQPC